MPALRRRPGESSQAHGGRWERYWARLFGVEPQRGSGSQWYAKLDVADGAVLWSCKHTDAESFRLDKGLMREVVQAINAQGGVGGTIIPGLALSIDGETLCVLRADDLIRMLTEHVTYIAPPADEVKRQRASVPLLLRDDA